MKRIFSVLISICILLSFVPATFAATSVFFDETFDSLPLTDSYTGGSSLDVFEGFELWGGATASIKNDGYRGNSLHIKSGSSDYFRILTSSISPKEAEPVYINFKFKVANMPENGNISINAGHDSMIWINSSSSPGNIVNMSAGSPIKYNPETWYDLSAKLSPGKTTVNVMDANGNVCVATRNTTANFLQIKSASSIANIEIAIDEVRILQGDGTVAPKLVYTSHGSIPEESTGTINPLFTETFTLEDGEDLTTHLKKQWPNYGGALIGNVWQNDNAILSTADDGKGGTALKVIVPSKKMPQIWTPSYTIPDSGKLYLAMRLNILDDANDSDALRIHTASSTDKSQVTLYAQLNNGESIFTLLPSWAQKSYTEGNWYDIVTMYEKDETSGKTYVTLSIYNADGTLLGSDKAEHTESDAALHFGKYSSGEQTEFIVDDVRVFTATGEPSINDILGKTSEPVVGDVWSTHPTIDVRFDSVVKGTIAIKDGDNIVYTTPSFEGVDMITVNPSTALEYNKEYYLDFSNVKSMGDIAASIAPIKIKTPEYNLGTLSKGNAVYTTDTITVPVNFVNSALKEIDCTVLAALYNENRLEWLGSSKVFGKAPGTINVLFDNDVPKNADKLTLKLFVWSDFATLCPLYAIAE